MIDGHPFDGARLSELWRRYGVAELAVFGSAARGDANQTSDVDLLYVLEPGARLGFSINSLEDGLAEVMSEAVKAAYPDVEWSDPVRLRNRIVHGYWSVDLEVLVATARDDLPAFIKRIRSADTEPPGQE